MKLNKENAKPTVIGMDFGSTVNGRCYRAGSVNLQGAALFIRSRNGLIDLETGGMYSNPDNQKWVEVDVEVMVKGDKQ